MGIIILFLSMKLFGYFLDAENMGNFSYGNDAKIFGMGNVWIFSSLNPANFYGTNIQVGTGISLPEEERSVWIFDTYNNTVGKLVIARNRNVFLDASGLSINLEYLNYKLCFTVSPYVFSSYRFYDVKRDEFYTIVEETEIRKDINLLSYSPKIGFNIGSLSAGLFASIIRGNSYFYVKKDTNITEEDVNYKGLNFGGGLNILTSKFLVLSLLYTSKLSLSADEDSAIYPSIISFGIKYNPPNILPVTFISQFEYQLWEEARLNGMNMDYDNIFILRFGVQHKLTSSLYLRLGYVYGLHYAEKTPFGNYTFGIGWGIDKNFIDIGIGLQNMNYQIEDVFFNETTTNLKLSVRRDI